MKRTVSGAELVGHRLGEQGSYASRLLICRWFQFWMQRSNISCSVRMIASCRAPRGPILDLLDVMQLVGSGLAEDQGEGGARPCPTARLKARRAVHRRVEHAGASSTRPRRTIVRVER